MLSILLSMPVSIGLLVWMWRMKKNDPFPKNTFLKLLIAGVISLVLSAIITIIGGIVNFIVQIGPDQLKLMTDGESALKVIQQINEASKEITAEGLLLGFVRTFILIGFVEEFFKFICAKTVMKKEGVVHTWKDALLCFAIVAIGFQLVEDIQYSAGDIVTAIFRAITPFHFTFAVIMGYIYGLGKTKGKGLYTVLALIVPALIHTMYDFSINLVKRNENFVFLTLAMNGMMFVLTIIIILKLRKWHKEGTLDVNI